MMDRDPPRLLETSGSFATRELLRTALEETAPGSVRQRVLSTISMAQANAAVPGTSAFAAANATASGVPSAVAAAALPVSTSSGVFEKGAATRAASAALIADRREEAADDAPIRLPADGVQGVAGIPAACASGVREARAAAEPPLPASRVARAGADPSCKPVPGSPRCAGEGRVEPGPMDFAGFGASSASSEAQRGLRLSPAKQAARAASASRFTSGAPWKPLGLAFRNAGVRAGVSQRMAALQLAAAVLIGILVGKGGHVLMTNVQASSFAACAPAAIETAHIGAESIERANIEAASIGAKAIGAVSPTGPRASQPRAGLPRTRSRARGARATASKTREWDRAASTANAPLDTAASKAHGLRSVVSSDQALSRIASRAHGSFEPASSSDELRSVASQTHERLDPAPSKADESLETTSSARASASRDRRVSAPHARASLPCAVAEPPQWREHSTPMAALGSVTEPRPTATREPTDDWLGEQLVILSRTERSLLAGNRDGALRSFDEYRARFPAGMLDFAMASLRKRAAPRFEAFIFP